MAGAAQGVAEVADFGTSDTAQWVIDGYATLFAELGDQGSFDVLLVPIGVGSLARPQPDSRHRRASMLIGVEPATAACLTASLAAGARASVPTPGTTMAGSTAPRCLPPRGPRCATACTARSG